MHFSTCIITYGQEIHVLLLLIVSIRPASPTLLTVCYVVWTGVHRGQVHIETKLEHVATRLSQEMKDDRSAVHALRRSLGPSLALCWWDTLARLT